MMDFDLAHHVARLAVLDTAVHGQENHHARLSAEAQSRALRLSNDGSPEAWLALALVALTGAARQTAWRRGSGGWPAVADGVGSRVNTMLDEWERERGFGPTPPATESAVHAQTGRNHEGMGG